MSNKKFGLILLVVALLALGGFGIWKLTSKNSTTPATNDSAQTYTMSQVADHNTAKDCWTIIEGSVYNITAYVPRHPGGNEILQACGNDATTLFTERTTTEGQKIGTGTPHSNSATQQLAQYKIGTLKN